MLFQNAVSWFHTWQLVVPSKSIPSSSWILASLLGTSWSKSVSLSVIDAGATPGRKIQRTSCIRIVTSEHFFPQASLVSCQAVRSCIPLLGWPVRRPHEYRHPFSPPRWTTPSGRKPFRSLVMSCGFSSSFSLNKDLLIYFFLPRFGLLLYSV